MALTQTNDNGGSQCGGGSLSWRQARPNPNSGLMKVALNIPQLLPSVPNINTVSAVTQSLVAVVQRSEALKSTIPMQHTYYTAMH